LICPFIYFLSIKYQILDRNRKLDPETRQRESSACTGSKIYHVTLIFMPRPYLYIIYVHKDKVGFTSMIDPAIKEN
ncbi:hypothetical protein VIGAN_04387000, partial [Vigna angularis var. angularis]